ncbi:hypothetical protein IE53DRAFT_362536 [Violaceomyces palustris]|uniref:Uncharacterized protein n=1 Tax=Violaceomyces palustris TaxID=1673888 RepID=A0ACD0NWM8_9BASI|nr:hypothetical protein IE53DRAFT_362536 [Violaceomyces palustris]
MQVESSPPPTSHFPAPSAGRRFSSSLARFGKSSTNLSKDYELSVSFARRGSDGRIGGKTSNSDLQSETSSSFFKNLGRPLSKGRKSVGSANGGLRDSMKKWASASTDALGVGVPGDRSRPGLGEAVALRQSLQIPRSGEPDVEYMVSPEGTPVASPSQNQTPRAQAPPSSARRMPRASFSLGRKSIDSLGRSMFGKSTDRLDAAGDASPKPGSSPRDTFARSRRSSATSIAKDFVKKTFGRKDRSSISSGSPGASPNASRFSRDGAFGSKESGLPTESEQERAREASKAFAAVFGAPIPGSMSRRASGNDAVPGASSSRRPSGVGPKLELPGKSQDGSSPQRSRPQFSREASNSSTAASFHSARDQHGSNMSLFTTVQWSEKSPFARQASPSRTTHAQAPCESLPPHQKNQSLEAPVQGTAPLLGGIAIDETQGWADSVLGESHGYGPSPNGSSLTGGTLPSTDTAISSAPSMSTSPSTAPTSADNGKVSATSILKEKEDGKDTTDPSLHIAAAPIAALADPNRRPSIGLHQEQDALEAGASPSTVVPAAPAPDSTSTTTTSHQRYVTATSDEPPPHRPQRSSRALSQLPRLNSLRAPPGGRMNQPGGRGGAEGSESRLLASGENESGDDGSSEDEQEMSEEDEDSEAEGEEGTDADGADEDPGFSVLDDTRTVDSSFGSSVTSTSSLSTDESFASAKDMASSAAVNARSSRPNDIILPPAPTFGTPPQPQAGTSASSTPSAREAVGRDSWTSFNSFPGFTPFETPTPKPLQMQGAAQTPKASEHENSYFSFRPRPPSRAGTLVGTNHDAPPPSPSVISRSRAPSSASQRTVRSIGSGQIPAPTPNRELPPMPPATLASLNIRGPHERSKLPPKSPRLAQSSHSSPFANGEGQPTPLPSRPTSSIQITPLSRAASVIDKGKQPERGASSPLANTSSASAQASPATRIVDLPWVAEDEATQVKGLGLGIMKPGDSSTLSTSSSSASRPALYQHKSKSLIDLSGASGRRMEFDAKVTVGIGADSKDPPTLAVSDLGGHRSEDATTAGEEKRLSNLLLPLPPLGASSAGGLKAWDQAPATPGLARRRSMFEIRTEPPPYSIIHRRPEGPQTIYPREEEGRERLPPYWCGVHIEGYLPRKMEFSAPGLQAKDRSWKRLYFVLHGTSLRVYKHDLSSTPLAQSGGWGELKGVHVHPEPMNEDGSTGGSGSSHSIGQAAREAISHSGLPLRHHNSSAINSPPGSELKSGLIRNYTLQNAESGLAADYLKRRHVVRVRAEGEQFLLQTRNDRHVVDWIEALQAATNVAMDLEKRQMPKFITLPRRRRRRRRNPDGTALTPAEQEERDLQEAQRRSMAEAQGGGRREEGSSGNGRARQSMSLENEMNPSAAFEEMLREEHEDMGSRAAADI